MSYVVQNIETGRYVCSGGAYSYTEKLQHARVYAKREDAERDCCGNERVLTIEQAMRESL